MDKILETVQASQLGGHVVADIIRDGRPRLVTYHGRPEAMLIKLPDDRKEAISQLLAELQTVLIYWLTGRQ